MATAGCVRTGSAASAGALPGNSMAQMNASVLGSAQATQTRPPASTCSQSGPTQPGGSAASSAAVIEQRTEDEISDGSAAPASNTIDAMLKLLMKKFEQLENRMQSLENRVDDRMRSLENRVDDRMQGLDTRLQKLDHRVQKLDDRVADISSDIGHVFEEAIRPRVAALHGTKYSETFVIKDRVQQNGCTKSDQTSHWTSSVG